LDCRGFEDWLDAGRPGAGRADADAHAASCAACRNLAAADGALETALAARLAEPSPDFTERVMARVAAAAREAAAARLPVDPELLVPWWTRLIREPATILGLALGAAYAGGGSWLLPLAQRAWPPALGGVRLGGLRPESWPPVLILACAVPLLAAASWVLYRATRAAVARIGAAS
jgi:hypothetical protein